MQVLHAAWDGDRFYLWPESSTMPMTAARIRGREPKKPKPRAHPFSLAGNEAVETEIGLPIVEVEAEGWLEDMLNSLSEGVKITPVKTPRTFHGKLRPYQKKGVSWLAYLNKFGLGACLADDMGLGKTIELIALLLHERAGKRVKKLAPTLLICPMSVVGNWQMEVERFAPSLKVMVHHGADRHTGKIFAR